MGNAKVVEKAPIPPESKEAEEWASSDDLGPDLAWTAVKLAGLGKKVRVRLLDTGDVASVEMLPVLEQFISRTESIAGSNPSLTQDEVREQAANELTPSERRRMAQEEHAYLSGLAHLAVMAADTNPDARVRCLACGFDHTPSLWSRSQTSRLRMDDLAAIMAEAVQGARVVQLAPFSEDETPVDTPTSASSGE